MAPRAFGRPSFRVALAAAGLLYACAAGQAAPAERVIQAPALQVLRPTGTFLTAIARTGDRLVAGGAHGVIIYSADDGRNWRQAAVPVSATITAIRFATPEIGWAVGHFGVVLRTDDGGATWRKQLDGLEAASILERQAAALQADPKADPVAAAHQAHEAAEMAADGADKPFLLLDVRDASNVLIFGAFNLAFQTTDGGATWRSWSERIENPQGNHGYGIVARGDELFIAGEAGLLLKGSAAELRLNRLEAPYKGSFFGALDGGGADIIAYGLLGHIYRTRDDGQTWSKIDDPVDATVNAATRLASGEILFGDMTGNLLALAPGGEAVHPLTLHAEMPIADLVQTAQGSLVLVGPGGLRRIEASELGQAIRQTEG